MTRRSATLLKRELERHGFEGVDIAFDAPATDWSAKLTNPTVNLFLYDLRENVAEADVIDAQHARQRRGDRRAAADAARGHLLGDRLDEGGAGRAPAALAGAGDPLLARLSARRPARRPARISSLLRAIETEVGRPKEEKADFWTSIGGRYKASIDYAVKLEVESGLTFTRGPEMRSQTVRLGLKDAPARTVEELQRFGGVVRDKDGEPVANAWVALPDIGRFASTNAEGQFTFDNMRPGTTR